MPRPKKGSRFNCGLYSDITWKPAGRDTAVSSLGHSVRFVLGAERRDVFLKAMAEKQKYEKSQSKLTARESVALEGFDDAA
jgi:hypothetical protein